MRGLTVGVLGSCHVPDGAVFGCGSLHPADRPPWWWSIELDSVSACKLLLEDDDVNTMLGVGAMETMEWT